MIYAEVYLWSDVTNTRKLRVLREHEEQRMKKQEQGKRYEKEI